MSSVGEYKTVEDVISDLNIMIVEAPIPTHIAMILANVVGELENTTIPTHAMIKNLTGYIVDGMTLPELKQFVYDDIYSAMLEDDEVFHAQLESLDMKPEDFTNEKK